MDDKNFRGDRLALADALKSANDAYERLSDEIAALIEAGRPVSDELQKRHSDAMRVAIKARDAADAADDDE